MCQNFYDVRTFGAVMSTGDDAGQVRGPVQLTFSRSLDPIVPMDVSITRMAVTDPKEAKASREGDEEGKAKSEPPLQTRGRKSLIPYGLYACQGFVSANYAADTRFTEDDLALFWEAMTRMFDDDHSASRGMMAARGLKVFKHVGTDSDAEQRSRQARLGCAPAHKLIEVGAIVDVKKRAGVEAPRRFEDYEVVVHRDRVPKGVEILEKV
jgi:CRISPR-associated protein Csd2